MLGLHYTFATNFLVSLFDEKLSRREIDPTNFLQRSSRPPPPGCPLDCSRECIETGQGMIECKRANSQIQHATEFDFVVVYHRTPGLDEDLAITWQTQRLSSRSPNPIALGQSSPYVAHKSTVSKSLPMFAAGLKKTYSLPY